MDPNSFDTLARSIGLSVTRRSVVSGSLVGLFALVLPLEEAGAKRSRRHGKDRVGGAAHDHPIGAEKKRKRKKKKKPAPCAPACAGKTCGSNGCGGVCGNCAGNKHCQNGQCVASCSPACGGKACGADGCGGVCGTCGSGESCENGSCVPLSGSCSPACVGGQVCQANGACVCPAATPIFHSGQGLCMECATNADCTGGQSCRHDLGHICSCNDLHECGGICWSCCTSEHCAGIGRAPEDGFICSVHHACICAEARPTACAKRDGSEYCVDLMHDHENCGACGFTCGSQTCIRGSCTWP